MISNYLWCLHCPHWSIKLQYKLMSTPPTLHSTFPRWNVTIHFLVVVVVVVGTVCTLYIHLVGRLMNLSSNILYLFENDGKCICGYSTSTAHIVIILYLFLHHHNIMLHLRVTLIRFVNSEYVSLSINF